MTNQTGKKTKEGTTKQESNPTPKKDKPITAEEVARRIPGLKVGKLPKGWCRTFFKR